MKQTIKKWIMPGLLLGFTISLVLSCKKENETGLRQQIADNTAQIISEPIAAESPKTDAATKETEDMSLRRGGLKTPPSQVPGVIDYVDFDDTMSLKAIPDYAKYGFAAAPFYIQPVGNAWIHVKENNSGAYLPSFISNYGHYHLSFQDFDPCTKQNGEFGKPYGGGCTNIIPQKERRELETHEENQWIKIYAYDVGNPQRVFDLQGIKVNFPLQLWFKKQNAGWFKWDNLTAGTWNLSAYSFGITEVLIASSGNGIAGFDNVKIKVPNY